MRSGEQQSTSGSGYTELAGFIDSKVYRCMSKLSTFVKVVGTQQDSIIGDTGANVMAQGDEKLGKVQ
jgi:hypothetical protein